MSRKIWIATITEALNSLHPYAEIMKNAFKFDHAIDKYVIYSSFPVAGSLASQFSSIENFAIWQESRLADFTGNLKTWGLKPLEIELMAGNIGPSGSGKPATASIRNYIILEALSAGVEIILFLGEKVWPSILVDGGAEGPELREVDVIGSHLEFLHTHNDLLASTSWFTGYHIPIFQHNEDYMKILEDFLQQDPAVRFPAVQREYCLEHIVNTTFCNTRHLALDLGKAAILPPFFSSSLLLDKEIHHGLLEGTIWGTLLAKNRARCIDIDLLLYEDLFPESEHPPAPANPAISELLFQHLRGICIDLPLLEQLSSQLQTDYLFSRDKFHLYLRAWCRNTSRFYLDKRYLQLPKIYKAACRNLKQNSSRLESLQSLWPKLINRFS
ncbi:MAG: hypothetical protein JW784_06925 [Candidatus Cloacimonetes bacterium]|nr:hypothetical protein [Candidatus Cloacimonadota bacterium]